ncbi:hypothetical protein Ancab_011829 [Ancistrocladus abbreviatus]
MAFRDEIYEIFSWLPVKTLFKFALVSRDCQLFLNEPRFQHLQAHRSLLYNDDDDVGCFIQPKYSYDNVIPGLDLIKLSPDAGLSQQSLRFLAANSQQIIFSANGLLLCRKSRWSNTDLYLCNPATRTWLRIPVPDFLRRSSFNLDYRIVLECDGRGGGGLDDCSLIAADISPHYGENGEDGGRWLLRCRPMVYSPMEGNWQQRGKYDLGSRKLRLDAPVFLPQVSLLCYLSDSLPMATRIPVYTRPYIMAFDVKDGGGDKQPRVIKLPADVWRRRDDGSRLLSISRWKRRKSKATDFGNEACLEEDSICLVRLRKRRLFTVWILVDHGRCMWRRIFKFRVTQNRLKLKDENLDVEGYTFTNKNCLIFATDRRVFKVNLEGDVDIGKKKKIEELGQHHCGNNRIHLVPYSGTLRACGSDGVMVMPDPMVAEEGSGAEQWCHLACN